MQDKIVLSSSPSDAVAVGPALLGFQPSESVVVVGLCGRRVAFCGRVDLADAQACTRDVLVAMRNSGADAVELVGYSQRPEWAALVLDGLARGPFDGAVIRQHVTDGATAWRCDRGELLDSEPFTPSLPQPERTRADTVAAVTAPRHPADANTVEARTAGASNSQRQGLLTAAMDSDELRPDNAADAAALLDGRDGLAAAVASIVRDPHRAYRNLLVMRQHCADAHLPGVLALLTLACWAAGHGPAVVEALTQLDALTPGSRTVALLSELTCSNPADWLRDNATA